jgi:hypothetical protein
MSKTKGGQNAARLGDFFDLDDIAAGNLAFTTSATTDAITHGLTGTPDFVILSRAETGASLTWAADTTTVTVTRPGSTNNIEAYSYIIGVTT